MTDQPLKESGKNDIKKRKRTKEPFRNSHVTEELTKNNPDITPEEITDFRRVWKIKQTNVRRYCKSHPDIDKERLLSEMPRNNMESLKKYNPLKYCKENHLGKWK